MRPGRLPLLEDLAGADQPGGALVRRLQPRGPRWTSINEGPYGVCVDGIWTILTGSWEVGGVTGG